MISVLLVDDEPGLLELGTIYLEKTGEFSVDTAPSAQNAMEMMESTRYDAIVSDFQMPGMDGIEFLKTIRSRDDTTPFIIFTGKGREEVVIEALNAGADFYLQKGGNPKAQFAELSNKIQYAVSRMRAEEALRESEEQYRTVIENAGEIIFVAQDGVLKFINRKTFELLQTPPENVIGKPFGDFIHPDDRAFVLDRYRRRMEGEDVPSNYECRLVNEAGDMIWAILSAVRISWEGRPATLNFVTDITARKEAEEELRESEEQYRTVVETTGTALVVIEEDTTISFANTEFETMTGFSKEEIEGKKKWTEFVVEEDLPRMLEQHHLRRQNGAHALHHYEFRLVRRDGAIRDMLLYIDVILGTKKSIASLIDITHRKQIEERYRRIFSGMPSAVAIYEACGDGEDFIIRDLNPRAEEIEQIAKDHVIGRRVTEVFPGVEDFGLFSVFQRVWRTGRPEYLPDAIYRDARDLGTWRENWVYRLPGGEIVAIYNDITERKQTENALRESEEKFRTLFESMAPGVFYQRSDGTIVDANPAALEMFGLTREECVGRDSHDPYWEVMSESGDILPPEKHPSMIALRTGTPVRDMIVGLHHPPGHDITWVSVNATPMYRDGETDPHQVVATMYNITDLKQADIELARRQKTIGGMLDGIPDIVGLLLPDYTVVRYNRAGYEALGATPGEVEGKKCFELIGRDEPCQTCAVRQVLGTKKTESIEKFVPELGRYFECSSTPILDENGDVELIIERLHDITGRIREEERSRIMAEMVDIAPSSITVHDYEGNFLFANQKTFDIHGYSRSEFLNLNLQELDVPESAAHIEEHMKRVAERTPLR